MMPREDGPKALVRVSKDTVPAWLSVYSLLFFFFNTRLTIYKFLQTDSNGLSRVSRDIHDVVEIKNQLPRFQEFI
jgi:hypothetical protein